MIAMADKDIFEILEDNGISPDEEGLEGMIKIDGYNDAIIGITDDYRLVYGYEKLISVTMRNDGCDEIEAMEYVDVNIVRAVIYYGKQSPIIIYELH